MRTQLFLGTNNLNKLKEFSRILAPLDFVFETPKTIRIFNFDPPENGETFDENAVSKTIAWAQRTDLPTLAEDSGICVCALGNFPGIKSKRFIEGSDQDRNQEILKRLKRYRDIEDRTAHYHCSLAFFDPETEEKYITGGDCYGHIDFAPSGNHGFGYDPIFVPQGFSQTLGILPSSVKDNISHRKRAIEKMLPILKKWQAEQI